MAAVNPLVTVHHAFAQHEPEASPLTEQQRITQHLQLVCHILKQRAIQTHPEAEVHDSHESPPHLHVDVSRDGQLQAALPALELSIAQYIARGKALQVLQQYIEQGQYPVARLADFQQSSRAQGSSVDRMPVFIDSKTAVHCAVGHIMTSTGHSQLATIVDRMWHTDYIDQLMNLEQQLELVPQHERTPSQAKHLDMLHAFKRWQRDTGLTLSELTWIQPTYLPGEPWYHPSQDQPDEEDSDDKAAPKPRAKRLVFVCGGGDRPETSSTYRNLCALMRKHYPHIEVVADHCSWPSQQAMTVSASMQHLYDAHFAPPCRPPTILMCHSLGFKVAYALLLKHPKLVVTGQVQRLVALNGACNWTSYMKHDLGDDVFERWQRDGKVALGDPNDNDCVNRDYCQWSDMVENGNAEDQPLITSLPVTFISGKDDTGTPSSVAEQYVQKLTAAGNLDATFKLINGGHIPEGEEPYEQIMVIAAEQKWFE